MEFGDFDLAAVGGEIRQQHARIGAQVEHHLRITAQVAPSQRVSARVKVDAARYQIADELVL